MDNATLSMHMHCIVEARVAVMSVPCIAYGVPSSQLVVVLVLPLWLTERKRPRWQWPTASAPMVMTTSQKR